MDKLKRIMELCKCGVHLTVNQHRDYYQTVDDFLHERNSFGDGEDIPPDVWAECVRTDTIIDLQVYPHTPIGSYNVYHYDLDTALDIILQYIDGQNNTSTGEPT